MGDIDGSTRSENGKSAGIVKAGGVCCAVLGLRVETESVSIPVSPATSSLLALAPLNEGRDPVPLVMLKVFSGKGLKTPRGSLRSLRVSSPVLVTVAVTFKYSNPSTWTLGTDALTVRPGVAETASA